MKSIFRVLSAILFFLAFSAFANAPLKCEKAHTKASRNCSLLQPVFRTHQDMPEKIDDQMDQSLSFDPNKNQWTLPVTILQFKDVSYTGAPSQIALVAYLDGKENVVRQMWIVVSFGGNRWYPEVFHFADQKLNIGQKVLLTLSGTYVSKSGVNWDQCPSNDAFCHAARRAEGNGPIALDWNNVEIVPTNELIWLGHRTSSWWGGALCWKITILSDRISLNSITSRDLIKPVQK